MRPVALDESSLQVLSEQVEAEVEGSGAVSFYGEPDQSGAYGERVGVAVDVCKRAYKAAKDAGDGGEEEAPGEQGNLGTALDSDG